jgi:16S rRNA (guanine527-N7)-methyltransferase
MNISFEDFYMHLCECFSKNNLTRFSGKELARQFYDFTDILMEANARFNLTAIRDPEDVIVRHYADCLLAERYFSEGAAVMDIGCGGGFPTFPLAIVRPDLKILAVDSTQKKIDFVAETAKKMGLFNVEALCARAESKEMQKQRERFDVVTSRAMANMRILSELALPYVKVGGKMVALKGLRGKEELEEAKAALSTLGGGDVRVDALELQTPDGAESRHLIVVSKTKPTPDRFPRNYSLITKKPL